MLWPHGDTGRRFQLVKRSVERIIAERPCTLARSASPEWYWNLFHPSLTQDWIQPPASSPAIENDFLFLRTSVMWPPIRLEPCDAMPALLTCLNRTVPPFEPLVHLLIGYIPSFMDGKDACPLSKGSHSRRPWVSLDRRAGRTARSTFAPWTARSLIRHCPRLQPSSRASSDGPFSQLPHEREISAARNWCIESAAKFGSPGKNRVGRHIRDSLPVLR